MTGPGSATAQLDDYLARSYPHLFSSSAPPSSSTCQNCSMASAQDPLPFTSPASIPIRMEQRPVSDGCIVNPLSDSYRNLLASGTPLRVPALSTDFDKVELLSDDVGSSPRIPSSDDCNGILSDYHAVWSSDSDQESIIDMTTSSFKSKRRSYLGGSMSNRDTIASKVEELLSEYRDGLESSWFRTPDQSKIYDQDLSDDNDTAEDISDSQSPDIVEGVWRRRRRSTKKENRRGRIQQRSDSLS